MAVETDLDRDQYGTNGTTGPWTVHFYFLTNADLSVTYTDATGVDTLLALDVGYSVVGAGDEDGGTVTTTTAYPPGGQIVILRDVDFVQETVYEDGDSFPAKTHERALDRLTMLAQQLREWLGRAISFPPSFSGSASLGDTATRSGKLLGFDAITGVLTFVTMAADSSVAFALELAGSAGSALVGFLQAGIGAVLRTIQDRLRDEVSFKDFGVVGDSSTPNLVAWNKAIARANLLGAANRFFGGVKLKLPNGTFFLEGAPDPITSSNVVIEGDSHGGTVIYAPNCTYDLVTFDGSALAVYNVGVKNLRFYTPGNASAGACIRLNRTINSSFKGLHFMGHFDAIVGAGIAQTKFFDLMFSQENRTSGAPRYWVDLQVTAFHPSDVHFIGVNSVYNPAFPNANSISIRGCDGVYFSNGHQHGATLVQPTGGTCSSVFWDDWYWDTSVNNNLKFQGTAVTYRGFHVSNYKMRASGGNAIEVNAAVPVNDITFTGGKISEQRLYGFYAPTACDGTFGDTIFDTNNTDNVAGVGDFYCAGSMSLHDSRFQGGGALGTAVQLTAASSDCHVKDNSFAASTAGTNVSDAGTGNKIAGNSGFTTKTTVPATINIGTNTVTVGHAMGKTPVASECAAKYAGAPNGGGQLWISAVAGANVTVRSENNVSANTGIYVTSDAEH